jgi:hypothetical protein
MESPVAKLADWIEISEFPDEDWLISLFLCWGDAFPIL